MSIELKCDGKKFHGNIKCNRLRTVLLKDDGTIDLPDGWIYLDGHIENKTEDSHINESNQQYLFCSRDCFEQTLFRKRSYKTILLMFLSFKNEFGIIRGEETKSIIWTKFINFMKKTFKDEYDDYLDDLNVIEAMFVLETNELKQKSDICKE